MGWGTPTLEMDRPARHAQAVAGGAEAETEVSVIYALVVAAVLFVWGWTLFLIVDHGNI